MRKRLTSLDRQRLAFNEHLKAQPVRPRHEPRERHRAGRAAEEAGHEGARLHPRCGAHYVVTPTYSFWQLISSYRDGLYSLLLAMMLPIEPGYPTLSKIR